MSSCRWNRVFGIRAKYCSACGTEVQRGKGTRSFDMDFCSEEHARQYAREMKRARQVALSRQIQSGKPKAKGKQGSHSCC